MDVIFQLSFDGICVSFLACCAIRELMIVCLPDRIAGPGGALIDTGSVI